MSWLLTSLLFSGLFVVVVFFVTKYSGNGKACIFAGTCTILTLCLSAVSIHCFATFVVAGVCIPFRGKAWAIATCSLLAAMATYGYGIHQSLQRMNEIAELQQKYPVVSLESRLAHEQNRTTRSDLNGQPALADGIRSRLSNFEQERDIGTMRRMLLIHLHDRNELEFVLAPGFGVNRMSRITRSGVELPEVNPISLPPEKDNLFDGTLPPLASDEEHSEGNRPSEVELLRFHEGGINDFVDVERLGYIEDASHVVGFEPHQFHRMPKIDTEWQVVRLELISLLRHEEPVAYVSDHLPSMEELKDVPVRALDSFERSALETLRSDEDVVIDGGTNRIRMVGSLRAAWDCLQCHSVERGELLGAFSYDIRRVQTLSEPADTEAY